MVGIDEDMEAGRSYGIKPWVGRDGAVDYCRKSDDILHII